ncbi:membrane integrity-associated transporter subunit PqiC [Ramlibacter sp. AW1]|uniref:Membrane integrity-associated transporter subunit PqiC n=1 Tax=Ramlibacter aurantiacus TaxID=2801330 RepID=A0A936ZV02_9BURK|nr:ABC-type transport auxiliary lipoprotein family protein [Ramlibacter aurantiacus]MBL0421064.1 membrane integrity-associated transporter subunit PqiC [Ramlibacter aurantiacus]
MRGRWIFVLMAMLVAGCAGLGDRPVRPAQYDLGPLPAAITPAASGPVLLVPELRSTTALEGVQILYRLAYDNPHETRPYTESRWIGPITELVRERLVAQLALDRPVLGPGQIGTVAPGTAAGAPQVLRLELQEFVHQFDAPGKSLGRLRLKATLMQAAPGLDRLIAQRVFEVSRPAPTPDAHGAVRALSAAVDELAGQLRSWLRDPTVR